MNKRQISMAFLKAERSPGTWIVTLVAMVFGMLTIKSGGSVLFIDGAARAGAGNYVPFVLWFNFSAGFAYLLAGAGLFMQKHGGVWISIFIAATTITVFAFFGLHILNGGVYETRTVVAMGLRSTIWTFISIFAYTNLPR